MSEYTFGDFDPDDMSGAGEPQSGQQSPKWFREYMDKVSGQLAEIKAENDRLKAEKAQTQVADALKAKGYAPSAAGLYQGAPEKLDDWLTAHGGALAKLPAEGQEMGQEQVPQGPPASTVPADGQEQMQRMMEQGTQGVAPPQGSDKELAAAIAACTTEEEYAAIMRAHGNRHDFS